jgi:hypothetical protein
MYKHVDDRTILVESTPMVPTLPDRPEPVRVEPRKFTYKPMLARMGWTDADFKEAQQFGFPAGGQLVRPGSFTFPLQWREDVLNRWANEQREKAMTILRLVG